MQKSTALRQNLNLSSKINNPAAAWPFPTGSKPVANTAFVKRTAGKPVTPPIHLQRLAQAQVPEIPHMSQAQILALDVGIATALTNGLNKHLGEKFQDVYQHLVQVLKTRCSQLALDTHIASMVRSPIQVNGEYVHREVGDLPHAPYRNLFSLQGAFYVHPVTGILYKTPDTNDASVYKPHGFTTTYTPIVYVTKVNQNTWILWDAARSQYMKYMSKAKDVVRTPGRQVMERGRLVSRGPVKTTYVALTRSVALPKGISTMQLQGFNSKTHYFHKKEAYQG